MISQEAKEKYIDDVLTVAKNIGMSPAEFYAVCWSMCASINLAIIENVDVLWSQVEGEK